MGRHSDDAVLLKMQNFAQRINDKQIGAQIEKPKSLSEKGGFVELLIDATDSRLTSGAGIIDIPMTGYGLIFASQGSDSGVAFTVSFNNDNRQSITKFKAGGVFKGYFERIVLKLDSTSLAAGVGRLIVLTAQDVDYSELPSENSDSNVITTAMGPSGAATQANGVASRGANAPALSSDGVSLEGVAGFKFTIELSNAASTITSGNIRLWWLNPLTLRWSRGPIIELLDAGGRSCVTSEYETKVPGGRVYCELCDLVASIASTATVQISTGGFV